jgi:hypothetical protein
VGITIAISVPTLACEIWATMKSIFGLQAYILAFMHNIIPSGLMVTYGETLYIYILAFDPRMAYGWMVQGTGVQKLETFGHGMAYLNYSIFRIDLI